MTLKDFFSEYSEVAIAFSGGVDSAYLLWAAKKFAKKVKAYYVKTVFQPEFELQDAKKLSNQLGTDLEIINLNILDDENVAKNPQNRCYFCKQKIFSTIKKHAINDGFRFLLDGTNASDDFGDRPGMKVLEELSVLSPLRLCNLTKEEIRLESKKANLFTWDKPAYACLATRIPSGTFITEDSLKRTEIAEDYLMSLGFSNFRVRTAGNGAKIQIIENQLSLLLSNREKIVSKLKEYYDFVVMDLEFRSE